MDYMYNEEFPRSILLTIIQYKLNIGSTVDLNEGAEIIVPTGIGTDGDHVHIHINTDRDGIVTPAVNMTPDMNDVLNMDLIELDLGCDGYYWSYNRNYLLIGALNEYAVKLYRNMSETLDNDDIFST